MSGSTVPATRAWRLTGIATVVWGAFLLSRGEAAWKAVAGGDPEGTEEAAIRVLGARHLAQGAFEALLPGRLPKSLIAVDMLHALSMVPLATENAPRRVPVMISAGVAATSAVALILARPGRHNR